MGVSSEIIGILVANGANVDTPTVLSSGTKVTPLEIVRLQPASHDNLQKELILLRAGAKDDVLTWLKRHKTELPADLSKILFGKGVCLRKKLTFLGYNAGEKISQCGDSYMYIKQKADGIRYDADFEIYDKGVDRLSFFRGQNHNG